MVVTSQWQIIERRRIAYEPQPSRFIYHQAAEIAPAAAEVLIARARAEAVEKAREEIERLISAVQEKGQTVAAAGVPSGNAKLPKSLAAILGAHSRIHAAEGAFYRDVLADACKRIGLSVKRTPERDLWAVASKVAGCGEAKLRQRFVTLGKELGPPWGEDQKLAALAAFAAV